MAVLESSGLNNLFHLGARAAFTLLAFDFIVTHLVLCIIVIVLGVVTFETSVYPVSFLPCTPFSLWWSFQMSILYFRATFSFLSL